VTKKREKFLVTMAWFAHSNHFAIEHLERREQRPSVGRAGAVRSI
jgi:hypothetical protein